MPIPRYPPLSSSKARARVLRLRDSEAPEAVFGARDLRAPNRPTCGAYRLCR